MKKQEKISGRRKKKYKKEKKEEIDGERNRKRR